MDEAFFPDSLEEYKIEIITEKPTLVPKLQFMHTEVNRTHTFLDDYTVMSLPCLEYIVVLKGKSYVPSRNKSCKASLIAGGFALLFLVAMVILIISSIASEVYAVRISIFMIIISILGCSFALWSIGQSHVLYAKSKITDDAPRDFSKDYIVAETKSIEHDLELYKKAVLSDEVQQMEAIFSKAYIHYLKLRLSNKEKITR